VRLPVKSGTANLGDLFSDAVKESFLDGDVYDCPNVASLTFLVHFIGEEGENLGGASGGGVSPSIVSRSVSPGRALSESSSESSFLDDYMEDFDFSGLKAWFHVSSSGAANAGILNAFKPKPKVTVSYKDADGNQVQDEILFFDEIEIAGLPIDTSGFFDKDAYVLDTIPPPSPFEGQDISEKITELMNKRPQDLEFKIEVTEVTITKPLKPGSISDYYDYVTDFANAKVDLQVELFVWVSLEFEAVSDGAKIKFPDMFDADEDLFGRTDDDDSLLDMIHSLKLEIDLSGDTFSEGVMHISADNNRVQLTPYVLRGNSLALDISNEDIERIKKTVPFAPDIRIEFEKGKILKIPRNLGATGISFSADIDYTIDL
jgi:hypothetical protein